MSGSFLLTAWLLEKYGPRLSMAQLAEVLHLNRATIYNQVSSGKFPVPTYLDQGARWADCRDVATHMDALRESAKVAA